MATLFTRRPSLRQYHVACLAMLLCLFSLSWSGCSGGAEPETETPPAQEDAASHDADAAQAEAAASDTKEAKAEKKPVPPGEAPFDTTYLDVDTELFIYAQVSEIINSSLVQTLTGGQLGPLDQIKNQTGIDPHDVASVTIGVGDLKKWSQKSTEMMTKLGPGAAMGSGAGPGMAPPGYPNDPAMSSSAQSSSYPSANDPAMTDADYPDSGSSGDNGATASSTKAGEGIGTGEKVVAVIRTKSPINLDVLEGERTERLPHGEKAYYRLKNWDQGQTPCLYLADGTSLVVADEPTIKQIIDQGADRPRPTADLGFVKKLPQLLVAVSPSGKQSIIQKLFPQQSSSGPGGGSGYPDSSYPGSGGEPADDYGDDYGQSSSGSDTAYEESYQGAPEDYPQGEYSDQYGGNPQTASLPNLQMESQQLTHHAEALALLVNLSNGVGLDVAIRCDSPKSAVQVQGEIDKDLSQIRQQFEAAKAMLPGMIQQIVQPLVDSLAAKTNNSVVTISTQLPEDRQSSLAMLPMAVMGMMMSGGIQMDNEFEMMASRRERAQEVVDQGVTVSNTDELPAGLEVKALARWGESRYGDQAPAPLEIAIAALHGPAAQAIAFGKLTLNEARINGDVNLKWTGTSSDGLDADPIDGFVAIERDGMFSDQPDEGVAAGFLVVPPTQPAAALQSVLGQMTLQIAGRTEEVMVPELSKLRGGTIEDARLADAHMRVDTSNAGRGALNIAWKDSPLIGKVEPVTADGSPVETIGTNEFSSGGRKSVTFSFAGPVPDGLGLRVMTYADLQEVAVPFRIENLPLPEPQELNEQQQALLVWTRGESPADHPDLTIEAQGRWRMLEPVVKVQMKPMNNPYGSGSMNNPYGSGSEYPDNYGQDTAQMSEETLDPAYGGQPSEGYQEGYPNQNQNRALQGQLQRAPASDNPLLIVVDLIGPLARTAEAIGGIDVTSVKTDIDTDLAFEGADVSVGEGDPVSEFVEISSEHANDSENPPGGLRVIVKLTPPNQPIGGIAQLNGSLKFRTVRERTEAILSNLQSRVGQPEGNPPIAAKPVNDRELLKYGLKPVVALEPNRVLMRLLEGKDEKISSVSLLDFNGDPINDVAASTQEGSGNARGHTVYAFTFPGGVPQKIGMKISVNMGIKDVTIPIRIRDMPLPPMPQDEK